MLGLADAFNMETTRMTTRAIKTRYRGGIVFCLCVDYSQKSIIFSLNKKIMFDTVVCLCLTEIRTGVVKVKTCLENMSTRKLFLSLCLFLYFFTCRTQDLKHVLVPLHPKNTCSSLHSLIPRSFCSFS